MITNPLAPGDIRYAEYVEQEIDEFRGNPRLEALPDIWSADQLRTMMAHYPAYNPSIRKQSPEMRRLASGCLLYYRQPVGVHLEMAFRLTNLLRWGYVARNPIHPRFQGVVQARTRALQVTGKGNKLVVASANLSRDF